MRKRNDAIVSENISDDKARSIGNSKFEITDSVNLIASTTMSISAGTVSISGKLALTSLPQGTNEQKILYMSDSGSVYYRTGVPLSLVLSASNSTGANDILFLNGRKSYSTHNGLTSSYTFTSGTSAIRSEGSRDYSNATFASQSASAVASKWISSNTSRYSKIDLNYNNGYSNAEIISTVERSAYLDSPASLSSAHSVSSLSSQDETIFSYMHVKSSGTTASTSIGVIKTASDGGFNTHLDRQATITLDNAGYMMANLGMRDKYGYSPNTRYSSSAFFSKNTSGTTNIVEISIPKRGNVNYANPPGPTHSVPVSLKAWIIANSKYSARLVYKAEIDALLVATASSSASLDVGGLEIVSLSTTETGNVGLIESGRSLGCGISSDGQNIFIGVSQSHASIIGNPVIWKVHYEYILGDWYGSVTGTYTKSLYE